MSAVRGPALLRRRVRVSGGRGQGAGRVLAGLLGLVVAYAGFLLILLATKSDPGSVDGISGYRSAVDAVAGLTDADASGTLRLAAGLGGLAAAVICLPLALAQIPRVGIPRGALDLTRDERGHVTVEPRAVERALEFATTRVPGVSAAVARWEGERATVALTATTAHHLPGLLDAARDAAREALTRHGLPPADVRVVLARYTEITKRELD